MNFFKVVLLIGTLIGVLQSKACDPKVKSRQELALDITLKDSAELFAGEGLPTVAEVPTQKVERIGTVEEIGEQLIVDVSQIATKAVTSSEEVIAITKSITAEKTRAETMGPYRAAREKLEQLDKDLQSSLDIFNEAQKLNDDGTHKYGEEIKNKAAAQYGRISDLHDSAQRAVDAVNDIRNETRKRESKERTAKRGKRTK